ncbi:MAG: fused MFS/spermidine synthase [Spirochaetota bacterium]|uniref:fused MFS/spermidine synthase n=1 Tax=Candidatus Jordarchaeum sp. TaxID=2823881 RepID=UPI00404AB84F
MNKISKRTYPKIIVFTIFFITGALGLSYEIVFRRQLLLSLGVTHYSVGTVLTVFMAGLGLGSIVGGKIADRVSDPILLFSILQAGIGIFGFLLTFLLPFLDHWYKAIVGSVTHSEALLIPLKACFAGIFLFPPTILMGGSLPALSKAIIIPEAQDNTQKKVTCETGGPVGILYGINNLGGVVGVLAVTFWIIGFLGARRTLVFASALSLSIGVFFSFPLYRKGFQKNRSVIDKNNSPIVGISDILVYSKKGNYALIAIIVSGFIGLSLEVYWARILAYIIGSHGYAFGVILASFIGGIATGNLIGSYFVDRIKNLKRTLGTLLVFLGACLFAVTVALYKLQGLVQHLSAMAAGSWVRFITFEICAVFLILLVPSLLLGMIFPIVISETVKKYNRIGTAVGRAYAYNTLGSIIGSFSTSFIFIPFIGITKGIQLLVILAVATGIFIILYDGSLYSHITISKLTAGGVLIVATFFISFGDALQEIGEHERLLFYRESSSATVAVREDSEGKRTLSINGLDEVPVDVYSLLTFRMLGHLPLLLHRNPQEVMVLSLGGAITTGSIATHPVRHIEAVDICPPVIEAAEFFEEWNYSVLRDRRLDIIFQDGRNYLLTINKRYDVIIADATHPWSADSWVLYTKEFYEIVKTKLANGGFFCQWIPLHWLSPDDYRCILRTMCSVFPEISLWFTGSYTIALAGLEPPQIDSILIAQRMENNRVSEDLKSIGIDSPQSLLSFFMMDREGIMHYTGVGTLNTDDLAYLEHSASRCYARETTPENLSELLRYREYPKWFPNSQEYMRYFNAREKLALGRIAMYSGNFERALRLYDYALTIAPDDRVSEMFLKDLKNTLATFTYYSWEKLEKKGDMEKD